jgi:hypothetical protein
MYKKKTSTDMRSAVSRRSNSVQSEPLASLRFPSAVFQFKRLYLKRKKEDAKSNFDSTLNVDTNGKGMVP